MSEGDGKGASWDCLGVCRNPEGLPVFASSGQLRTGLIAEETQLGIAERQCWHGEWATLVCARGPPACPGVAGVWRERR